MLEVMVSSAKWQRSFIFPLLHHEALANNLHLLFNFDEWLERVETAFGSVRRFHQSQRIRLSISACDRPLSITLRPRLDPEPSEFWGDRALASEWTEAADRDREICQLQLKVRPQPKRQSHLRDPIG